MVLCSSLGFSVPHRSRSSHAVHTPASHLVLPCVFHSSVSEPGICPFATASVSSPGWGDKAARPPGSWRWARGEDPVPVKSTLPTPALPVLPVHGSPSSVGRRRISLSRPAPWVGDRLQHGTAAERWGASRRASPTLEGPCCRAVCCARDLCLSSRTLVGEQLRSPLGFQSALFSKLRAVQRFWCASFPSPQPCYFSVFKTEQRTLFFILRVCLATMQF